MVAENVFLAKSIHRTHPAQEIKRRVVEIARNTGDVYLKNGKDFCTTGTETRFRINVDAAPDRVITVNRIAQK